ncbi:peptidoglycan DD-metalloendopeptidase family protein [Paenibacillus cymbidii]|uniref:peptidoglycan DD-metalloendopeptidase family protein n=1 Tax=Paenibacillus cymbidii TaxID=1639034 RepID=UPI0010800483|nr:peptidoglycan DD-metalloendopeptidase family protein [Paenibacillus cymbidii]
MTGFKLFQWIKDRRDALAGAVEKIRSKRLNGPTTDTDQPAKKRLFALVSIQRFSAKSAALAAETGNKLKQSSLTRETYSKFRVYRNAILGSAGAFGLATALTVGGDYYVKANTFEVYHVLVGGQEAGIVSSPQVVDDYKIAKVKQVEQENPNVHMVLNTNEIVLRSEKAYKITSDDEAALKGLDGLIKSHAVGVKLFVDGKLIGTMKDKDEADQMLEQIKSQYTGKKSDGAAKVSVLSAPAKELNVGESELQSADFVQKVEVVAADIEPSDLQDPNDLQNKLVTGDVQPTKYVVQSGDCISCIAKKFNISKQAIYNNNPWIVDDKIKVGQVMDLTVLQPTLSVRTVEKVVENQEIQYDTEYQKDDTMRAGTTKVVSPGKNGLKKVTINVTKVNGLMADEQVIGEEVIEQPVKAVAVRGTKVVLGEGTGKFAYPVLSASLSSGFGYRWGALHKGLDFTSPNKNILASDNGKVVYSGYDSGYGNHIIIDHMNGYRTLYGHMSKLNVSVGKIVEKGEVIGIMGSTGDSTGVHLHFEVQRNGVAENPLKYLTR